MNRDQALLSDPDGVTALVAAPDVDARSSNRFIDEAIATARLVAERRLRQHGISRMTDLEMFLRCSIATLPREVTMAVSFDTQYRFLGADLVALGGPSEVWADPHAMSSCVLARRAHFVVMAHNHPAGDPTPSAADGQNAGEWKWRFSCLGVCLLDSVVVTLREAISLREREFPADVWPKRNSAEFRQRSARYEGLALQLYDVSTPTTAEEDAYRVADAMLKLLDRQLPVPTRPEWGIGFFRKWIRENPNFSLAGLALNLNGGVMRCEALAPRSASTDEALRVFSRFAVSSYGTRFAFAIRGEVLTDTIIVNARAGEVVLASFGLELIDILLVSKKLRSLRAEVLGSAPNPKRIS